MLKYDKCISSVMELLRKTINTIHRYWVQRSSEADLNYLRKSGVKTGDTPFSVLAALCLPIIISM